VLLLQAHEPAETGSRGTSGRLMRTLRHDRISDQP
jgi:hypothetical protein